MQKNVEPAVINNVLKLSIKERLYFTNILPAQGNLIDMTLRQDIIKKVAINQEEIKNYNIRVENEATFWDAKKDTGLPLLLTNAEIEYLKKAAKQIDQESKITCDTLSIIKKIFDLLR